MDADTETNPATDSSTPLDSLESGQYNGTKRKIERNQELIGELSQRGKKYNLQDIIAITKNSEGKIVWLENGNDSAGLNHIIQKHRTDFINKGIAQEELADYLMYTVEKGRIVGYQGRGVGRPIYEVTYNGITQKVAISIGNNGFIVGANPISGRKEVVHEKGKAEL